MRKLIICIGLISILASCEKQQDDLDLHLAVAPTSLEEVGEKAIPTFLEENMRTEEIVLKPTKASSRSTAYGYSYQEVYSNSYAVSTGHGVNLEIPKYQLSNSHQYVAVVTPKYGDPDLYVRSSHNGRYNNIYGRNRRYSTRRGIHLDESWLNYRDVDAHETHGVFSFHATYSCSFDVIIYEVPVNTIWVRHASTHYGNRAISVRYRDIRYEVRPSSAVAIPYNYQNPSFGIYQCTKSPYSRIERCGWNNGHAAQDNGDYMFSLSDAQSSSDGSTGGVGFDVTTTVY